ncbi:MAG: TVP38/TMEM64 family protein [Nostocaceae cyanobacterium]|nr:TVP38/TMEM64 family protein [Nostocaceae cyanobacterium]
MNQQSKHRFSQRLKLIFISALIIILMVLLQKFNLQEILQPALSEVKNLGFLAPLVFILIYNLATLLFVPGSILTIKGGCLFGVFWGSLYVVIAAIIGATGAFLIGRYLSRDWVSQQIGKNPKFQAIDTAVAKDGWKIVLLTRLSPIFPFNLLNYAFGVTQVSLKDYLLGSIGIVPGSIMYVYIGSLVGDLAMVNTPNQPMSPETEILQWVIRLLGLIATVAVTIYVARLAKQAINDSV